ncbi:MAG: BamA/TamA family outer membrane protein [Candidatus Eisenbacteria bacterium]|nr:BamA/TamA family outer membrane protein [Candidatus Eisenbacteria bacterium]
MKQLLRCPASAIVAAVTFAIAMSAGTIAVAADRSESALQSRGGADALSAIAVAADTEVPSEAAGIDTIYVPDLVAPEAEQKAEEEVQLKEGPNIEIRFGKNLKELSLDKKDTEGEFSVSPSLSYDRVDGLSLFMNEEFSDPERLYPRIHLLEGYAFASKKWRYKLDFEQPLFSPKSFSFGASVYLVTDSFDKELTGDVENSLSSLFLKKDYRDYFEREGAAVFVKQRFSRWNSVKVQYAEDTYGSVDAISKGLFYRHSRQFRENPAVDEGKWATVAAQYELDSRQDEQAGPTEHWHRLEYESGRHQDEPCMEYTRLAADLRTYLNLNPGQYLSCRLKLGATPSGTLPFQKEFCVGGIGTLAAHDYKEFRGDHMILFNAEYAIDVVKRFQFIMITDVGKAWLGRDALKDQSLDLDVGIGVGLGEGVRVFAAKSPREEGSDVVWTLRLERTF